MSTHRKLYPSEIERRSHFYYSWYNMIIRCKYGYKYNKNNACYSGITVCDRWKNYKNFKADMYDSWAEGLTIDRIDNTKGYDIDNCRWATKKEQANNTRRNRKLTYNEKTLNISQWAELTGIRAGTIRQRIYIYGWSIDKALTTKVAL